MNQFSPARTVAKLNARYVRAASQSTESGEDTAASSPATQEKDFWEVLIH